MTTNEIKKIIIMIRANYDNAFRNIDFTSEQSPSRDILYGTWKMALDEYPLEVVQQATVNAIKHSEFPPRLNTIVAECEAIIAQGESSAEELWAELVESLSKVRRMAYYLDMPSLQKGAVREIKAVFNGMSSELKHYVVTLDSMVGLSLMSEESLFAFERGRFYKRLPEVRHNMRVLEKSLAEGLIRGRGTNLIDKAKNTEGGGNNE